MAIAQTGLSVTAADQQKAPDIAGNLGEGLKTGIQLATAAETIEASKNKMQEMRMELAQKQASALTNRTKAAMFANSPASFEAIMKGNESYANSIGVPYNGEAIRAAWKDPSLRLAAQREVTKILQGGQLTNPQAIIDLYGADSHIILQQLQEASYANAQTKNKNDQQTKIESMGNASAERIAQINADAKIAGTQRQNDKDWHQALRLDKNKLEDIIKDDRKALKGMQEAEGLLSGSGVPQAAGQRSLAKAFNVGALTDADVESLSGNKGVVSRLKQILQTAANGKLTEQNFNELKEIAAIVKPIVNDRISMNVNDAVERFQSNYGGDKQQIFNSLAPQGLMKAAPSAATAPQAPSAPAAPKGGFDMQKFQEALQRAQQKGK